MTSTPEPSLPLFYKDLVPLNSQQHADFRTQSLNGMKWLAGQHAIPLTIDEFVDAHLHYPIVFGAGENGTPLALMGLNQGVNVFVDNEGRMLEKGYIPAYARRYPYLLARPSADTPDLTLFFDPTSGAVGPNGDGEALFDSDKRPAPSLQKVLDFCEKFEQAGARTQAFMKLITERDLLTDGEIAITPTESPDKPFIYRGFRMIDREKLRLLEGDVCHEWVSNGVMERIYAHLFSLALFPSIFERQSSQGKLVQEGASSTD